MLPWLFALAIVLSPVVLAQTCNNYGTASGSSCLCPPGFNPAAGDGLCDLSMCGGSLYDPGPAAPTVSAGLSNISVGSCGCSAGWQGPACTVCSSASSCSSSLSKYFNSSTSSTALTPSSLNTSMTCSSIPTVYSASQMSCNVVQQTLNSLFPGQTTLTITRMLNSSLTPGGDATLTSAGLVAGNGQVWAQLWYLGEEQFGCQGSNCSQVINAGSDGVNGSVWTCPTLSCSCKPGATFCVGAVGGLNLTNPIDTLVGPLTIDCEAGGLCHFQQTFLNSISSQQGLPLSDCSFGECVEQYVIDNALGITSATSSSGLSGGVIAGLAVVGLILLVIASLVIWGLFVRRRARKNLRTDGALPKSGGVQIRWSGVGYEVKTTESPYASTAAWLKGSGGKKAAHQAENGTVVGSKGGKVVLQESHGQLPAGAFCCILGPSGAGKSTLVDILAGKSKSGSVQGKVIYVRERGDRRVKLGYVDQSDVLSPTSTVLETFVFAAHLRLPENIPKSVKEERAHLVLKQLGLADIAHTRVGSSEHRGISGGEMRRVSIGIELVAAPDVLVLDEPTSGLDSVSAARLVKLLKNLTESEESRTTIITSIHQPSSALYHSFNQVVLLAGGRQLYFGPGGNAPAEYFAKQGQPCPSGYNVADHLLEIASEPNDALLSGSAAMVLQGVPFENGGSGSGSSSSQMSENEKNRTTYLPETSLTEKNLEYTSEPVLLQASSDRLVGVAALGDEELRSGSGWWPRSHCATTFLTQIEVLSGREWRNLKRDKTLLFAHVFFACLLGIFAGGLYYKVNLTIAGFQNRVGSLFFLGSLIAFSSLSGLYNLVEVRGLFLRERASSFYSPQAWLLSRVLFDIIPLRLLPTVLVSVIVYFMVGLSHDAARFFKYLLILVEYSSATTLFNFLLACTFTHGGVAILISSLCNLFLMTYAGFFVNLSQIPPVLRWLRYFSTLGYTLEALAVNEVGSGLQIIDTLDGVPIAVNATLIMELLFGFKLGDYYRDVLVLFAFTAGFAVLLVGMVVFRLRERR